MLYHNCAIFSVKNKDKYFFNQFSEHSCICGIADGHGGGGASKRLFRNSKQPFNGLNGSRTALKSK
jgi:serine/threonine protein phosphatase PrpC